MKTKNRDQMKKQFPGEIRRLIYGYMPMKDKVVAMDVIDDKYLYQDIIGGLSKIYLVGNLTDYEHLFLKEWEARKYQESRGYGYAKYNRDKMKEIDLINGLKIRDMNNRISFEVRVSDPQLLPCVLKEVHPEEPFVRSLQANLPFVGTYGLTIKFYLKSELLDIGKTIKELGIQEGDIIYQR